MAFVFRSSQRSFNYLGNEEHDRRIIDIVNQLQDNCDSRDQPRGLSERLQHSINANDHAVVDGILHLGRQERPYPECTKDMQSKLHQQKLLHQSLRPNRTP